MDLYLVIIVILGLVVLLGGFFIIWLKKQSSSSGEKDNALLMMQEQLKDINRMLDEKMRHSSETMDKQFNRSAKIIEDVTSRLTKLDETNRQVVGFAEQLKNFENILKSPKQRGILGEYFLESVLSNVLPPDSYKMQYAFSDGEIVDAVVFVRDKIIPIDSKFSLENYNKLAEEQDPTYRENLEKVFKADLKKRIDETSKYIRPKENTTDFAFMFIPAEGIYYDLLINQVGAIRSSSRDLIEYAFSQKHVIIISPTTFHAYLQTIMQGLKALEIEKSAQEIRKRVEDLSTHIKNYDNYFKKIGGHLSTTVNAYNSASKELTKIDKDVYKITGQSVEIEVDLLDRPKMEDE
ncbi:MAG: DNA recombination protein RmuC [Candidatus Liptonbacteria bacterium CG11_big_fil_rev_8_21_14_0_20_35_14]|uniref:DNA recombination protein RmuC n=1 Tax=Candidatus Liptonbacteria bacterium CG11_big_fil_rev_8_21_14_0_20_35_14 TaxID=1974634 RepID=A0A2H0N7M3_9BACT|nr:MAG: DNA recombination protein RmuC [Candidatus Liptonbacteria bacterium CG11_big_fil_rev_8_21_14_0_20_35_14]